MNSKKVIIVTFLTAFLVIGIVLISGWWIWSFTHPEFCLTDTDCRYEKWERVCINKYALFLNDFEYLINPPSPLSFESFYIEENMPCSCIDKKCIGDIGILCKKACEDWKVIDCISRPVPTSEAESVGITAREAFFQMNCEKKIDCKCLEKQVTITIDKTEYEQGEAVELTIKNSTDKVIFYYLPYFCNGSFLSAEGLLDKWYPVTFGVPKCKADKEKKLNTNSEVLIEIDSMKLEKPSGPSPYTYRLLFKYLNKTIYSNEFTIKEKSSFDPRCSEKVKFSGNCEVVLGGIEFDSNIGKCVIKDGNCSVETPFNSLEECQKVCEFTIKENPVADYFENAELQFEDAQKENIANALNDILALSEEQLKAKKYKDYGGKENQWDLPTLIYRHFVPDSKGKTLGNNFFHDVKLEEAKKQVKQILEEYF